MNVKELNEKYQRIQNWQGEYRNELLSYIDEAFAMHGNEFALKPEGFDSWKDWYKSEEFDAMEDIPTYVMIWDRHGNSHEIYITRAYRENGYGTIYVDGFDYTEGRLVEGWFVNGHNDDLESIACLINAVFEQESENC